MSRQLAILAGGLGTRLKARLGDLPKPMIPIGGRPLLEHHVELARKYGFDRILIFACYRADLIQQHFGDGSRHGVSIQYLIESAPRGTAGAILDGLDRLDSDFAVIYGDTMMNVDLERMWRRHIEKKADATLLLHPNDHPLDSDLVEVKVDQWIMAFHNRPHPSNRWFQNLVNAGLYVIRKEAMCRWAGAKEALDFGKDLFPAMLREGRQLHGYNTPEYIKDIGTPDRYDKICAEFESGVVERSSLKTPQPVVFLDRDGTLVKDVAGLVRPEQLELLPGVAEAVRNLNHHGVRTILITNQPVIAKGFCSESDLQIIHNKMETLLGQHHAFLDRIYYCPHHPARGFPGERTELKIDCACRKPNPGMIQTAAKELNLDLQRSWLIGDTTTDLQTARNAGIGSILVHTGSAGRDGKYPATPDASFDTLQAAAQFVVEKVGKNVLSLGSGAPGSIPAGGRGGGTARNASD